MVVAFISHIKGFVKRSVCAMPELSMTQVSVRRPIVDGRASKDAEHQHGAVLDVPVQIRRDRHARPGNACVSCSGATLRQTGISGRTWNTGSTKD